MPIRVECDCGRAMTVKDELAGKLVKCPECKETLRVPSEEEDEAPRKRSQAVRRRRDEEDDYEDDRPARRKRASGRYDDEDDYDDDYDRPRRKPRRQEPVTSGLVTMLSIGIGALVFLALSTIPRVYNPSITQSSSNKEVQKRLDEDKKRLAEMTKGAKFEGPSLPGFIDSWRGIVILIISILVAAAVTAALILLFTVRGKVGDIFLLVASAVASGWGVLVLLWFLGYVFKGFTMSSSNTIAEIKTSVTVWPGWGLLFGIVFAGTIIGLFCPIVLKRGALWGLIGLLAGALVGLLLLALDARPWENPGKDPTRREKPWFVVAIGPGSRHLPSQTAGRGRGDWSGDGELGQWRVASGVSQRTSSKAKRLVNLFAGQGVPSTSTYG